jgi:hypothetical protein
MLSWFADPSSSRGQVWAWRCEKFTEGVGDRRLTGAVDAHDGDDEGTGRAGS